MKRQCGASLIEIMMAVVIVAGVAGTIYPLVFKSKKIGKEADFQQLCINVVRSKLNDYKNGAPTAAAGVVTSGLATNPMLAGFAAVKKKYNSAADYARFCPNTGSPLFAPLSDKLPVKVVASPPSYDISTLLGREECISSQVYAPFPNAATCTGQLDVQTQNVAKGFRVFVSLRRSNPLLQDVVSGKPPLEDCVRYGAPADGYDFQQAGDSIKITVTGLVDVSAGAFADINSASPKSQELVCQISDYVRPMPVVARYYMTQFDSIVAAQTPPMPNGDHQIYRWAGPGASGISQVLSSVTTPPGLPAGFQHISFAVSPDDKYVYVLRRPAPPPAVPATMQVLRYAGCTGDPLECPAVPTTSWDVDATITSITAMWVTDPQKPNPVCGTPDQAGGYPVLFGYQQATNSFVCLNLAGNPSGGACAASPCQSTTASEIPFVPPTLNAHPPASPSPSKILAILTDAQATGSYLAAALPYPPPDLYYENSIQKGVRCAFFNANDTDLDYPVEWCQRNAIAFSK